MGVLESLGEIIGIYHGPYGEENAHTTVYGRESADHLYGVQNSLSADHIYGFGGNDYINAYQGNDIIDAGAGDDVIRGGQGMDEMTGGPGFDEFRFSVGDSGPDYNHADIIWDWDVTSDVISFDNILGSPNTYYEEFFNSDGTLEGAYNQALSMAQHDIGHFSDGSNFTAFYTDGHNGYLFADNNLNGRVDTGIELRGVTSLDQFNWSDMI
jgi:Ca2+-binding RTX toxin-like protein